MDTRLNGIDLYARRFPQAGSGHFRQIWGKTVSSIGLGTAGSRGASDRATQRDAIVAAASGGVNLIDSSANYGFGEGERAIGDAIVELKSCGISRDELVICTKAGYIPSRDPNAYFANEIVHGGLARFEDLIAECHCIAPGFLRHQIDQSLQRLNTTHIDIFLLHNLEEQAARLNKTHFAGRVRNAFEALEEEVVLGRIDMYGISTWDGFRCDAEKDGWISLPLLVKLAETVAGSYHHFRVVQLPFNPGMTEAATLSNQPASDDLKPCLEIASDLSIAVVTSSPLMQGRLARRLPAPVRDASPWEGTIAQKALQFARSMPGVTSALVGMKGKSHVDENLGLISKEPLSAQIAQVTLWRLQGKKTDA